MSARESCVNHQGITTPPRPASPSAHRDLEAKRGLVERIVASSEFRRAARLSAFLRYVAAQALDSGRDHLSEHEIGVAVFDRPSSYDPVEDNIVRVNARQLRLKLRSYFANEGSAEPLVLEIPRGSYLPVFRAQAEDRGAMPPAGRRWRGWWIGAVLVPLAVVLGALLARPYLPAMRAVLWPPPTLFREFFSRAAGPIHIIVTDSALAFRQHVCPGPISLEDYLRPKSPSPTPCLGSAKADEFLNSRQTTTLADLNLVATLIRQNPRLADRLVVRHAKNVRARDMKEGNFLVIGGPRANPWGNWGGASANFRIKLDENGEPYVANAEPRNGEPRVYRGSDPGSSVAIITMRRSEAGRSCFVLVAGTRVEATEAAAEFFASPSSLQALEKLGVRDVSITPKRLELVLGTSHADGTALNATIRAFRVQ